MLKLLGSIIGVVKEGSKLKKLIKGGKHKSISLNSFEKIKPFLDFNDDGVTDAKDFTYALRKISELKKGAFIQITGIVAILAWVVFGLNQILHFF